MQAYIWYLCMGNRKLMLENSQLENENIVKEKRGIFSLKVWKSEDQSESQ